MQASEHEVIIAGGGPTGLMLAGELALGGVDVAIIERRMNQEVEGSRASGLHPRSIELLDQRGIAERFISQGEKHRVVPFAISIRYCILHNCCQRCTMPGAGRDICPDL